MKNKEDLRIRRTHKLLCDAMFSLLEKKSFDDISVVEICDKAMVHRATFYKHFEDKYHFMEYVMKEKIREFYENNNSHDLYDNPKKFFGNLVSNIIDFIYMNKKMLKISVSPSSNGSFIDSVHKIVSEEICGLLQDVEKHGVELKVPAEVGAQFFSGGILSLIKWWIISDSDTPKEQVITYFDALIDDYESFIKKKVNFIRM